MDANAGIYLLIILTASC